MQRPIAISLSPNVENDDVNFALSQLFLISSLVNGVFIEQLINWFKKYFEAKYVFSFCSARGGLALLLQAAGIGKEDEVLMQAFTCVAVPNAVLSVNAVPVYVDILDSYTIDPLSLEKRISKQTKAIIVQHTFGIASNMQRIMRVAKKYNLLVIEDCAHTIGGTINGEKLGTFGDASVFSFGRDKAFSSVFGGVVITNNKKIGSSLLMLYKRLQFPSKLWVLQQLLHPPAFSLILPFYETFNIGKLVLVLMQKLHLLSFPVSEKEKRGVQNSLYSYRMPNALACLALHQLEKLEKYNKKRTGFTAEYARAFHKNLHGPLLRYPIQVQNREMLLAEFRKHGIYLGTWYASVIDPKGVSMAQVGYKTGDCPHAEFLAEHVVNLPTYPTLLVQNIEKIIRIYKTYVTDKTN